MAWTIEISDAPKKVLARLDKRVSGRILDFLTKRIAKLENPRSVGKRSKAHGLVNSGSIEWKITAFSARFRM